MPNEPTRDEINRALAEWEGYRYEYLYAEADDGFDIADHPTEWREWLTPEPDFDIVDAPPDYCSSLDAQMPLWEKAGIIDAEFDRPYNEKPYGRWRVDMKALYQGQFLPYVNGEGQDIPEASARALYAVLEASR